MSASSGKPYLSLPAPLVAPVREQRFAPAQAGDAFSLRFVNPHLPPPVPSAAADIASLRRTLRARRRAVPPADRKRAALRLALTVARAGWLKPGRRVGLYLPLAEEIDTHPLLALAQRRRCQVFVPRVTDYRRHRMRFMPLVGRLRKGRYGILEPRGGAGRSVRSLDLLLMPLVGFDAHGNRIGMGKGYYDRALAYLDTRRSWRRPLLVGLAFECQRLPSLPVREHDVPLSFVVTEVNLHRFSRQPTTHRTPT